MMESKGGHCSLVKKEKQVLRGMSDIEIILEIGAIRSVKQGVGKSDWVEGDCRVSGKASLRCHLNLRHVGVSRVKAKYTG